MFFKWAIPGLFFFILVFSIQLTINVQYKFLPMTGFEMHTSGIGSDRSTNWAITTAHTSKMFNLPTYWPQEMGQLYICKLWLYDIWSLWLLWLDIYLEYSTSFILTFCPTFQLNDFGRNSLDDLEVKEKQLKDMIQKRQLQALQYDANLLLLHTNQVSVRYRSLVRPEGL